MIPAVIVAAYLCVVLYIGIFAFRKGTGSRDDFFVAGRSLGPWVFLLAIFGTNMTAFAILGSSGLAYQRGIGVYGLMASASGLVIPLCLFFIGTRLWALGKKFGHVTQVQFFRDRWECSHIGTVIFALTAAMLVPYIIIGVMGGGHTLEALTTVMGADGKPVLHEVVCDGKTVLETRHWVSFAEGKSAEAQTPGTLELYIEPNDGKLVENADNLTIAPWGDLIVCEDGTNPQYLTGVTPRGKIYKLAKTTLGELAGAVFSPDGSTLFVNIQTPGVTVAITGPWDALRNTAR